MKQQILEYLLTIPKGKVATYSRIAKIFHTHPRAVASIMRTNKQPEIYPCYKVVNVSGELLGYNNGWPSIKRKLLAIDGVKFVWNRVSSECIL